MKQNRKTKSHHKGFRIGILFLVMLLLPFRTAEAKWVKNEHGYRYTKNVSGTQYYKNQWVKIKGKYYYFDKKGYRKTGWLKYNGKRYYLNKSGVRVTGFQTIQKKKYYFTKKGVMVTGWLKYRNQYYYLDNSGVVQTGLQAIGQNIYYFDGEGKRISGANIVLGNLSYYFSGNGTLQYTGTEEEQAAKYINIRRLLKGYDPLTYQTYSNLSLAASLRAQELAKNASHVRPDGTQYSTILIRDYPVSAHWSGECILWGRQKSGTAVADSWLADTNSSILLQPKADNISIGRYVDQQGCEYWAAIVIQVK
ncbi:MAG: hypothetical protein IJ801_09405 [Lachnospiraceae bacterium]|nr:hypothetical protein [Lachnospiraceae bacterium]